MINNKSSDNILYSTALIAVIIGVIVFICLAVFLVGKELLSPFILAPLPSSTPNAITVTEPSVIPEDYSKDITSIIQILQQENPPSMLVAYSYESGPYTFLRNGPEGLEIDIIHEFEQRWFKGRSKIVFQGIGVDDRVPQANLGKYDFVVGAISRTNDRCGLDNTTYKLICTDTVHMRDKTSVMLNPSDSLVSFDSLDEFCSFFYGKKVGFLQSTTSEKTVVDNQKKLYDCPENVFLQVKDNRQSVVRAVAQKEIAGYFTDGAILRFYANDFLGQTQVVDFSNVVSNLAIEEYTFLLPENYLGLRQLMDNTLQAMICDGTLANIYKKYSKYIELSFSTPPMIGQQTCKDLPDLDIYPFIKKR